MASPVADELICRLVVGAQKTYPVSSKVIGKLINRLPILEKDIKIIEGPKKKVRKRKRSVLPFKGFTTRAMNLIQTKQERRSSLKNMADALTVKQKKSVVETLRRKCGIIKIKTGNGLKVFLCQRKFMPVQATASGGKGNKHETEQSNTSDDCRLESQPAPNSRDIEPVPITLGCTSCTKNVCFERSQHTVEGSFTPFHCDECLQDLKDDSCSTASCSSNPITSIPSPNSNAEVKVIPTALPEQNPVQNLVPKLEDEVAPQEVKLVHSLADLMTCHLKFKRNKSKKQMEKSEKKLVSLPPPASVEPDIITLEPEVTSTSEKRQPDPNSTSANKPEERVQLVTIEGIFDLVISHSRNGDRSVRILSMEPKGAPGNPITID